MVISSIPTAFISGLENQASIVPILIKDSIDIVGRTSMAYTQTDKKSRVHEARERLIEEAGTGVIWLGSIPLLRKIFDKTLFNKFNPDSKRFNFDSTLSLKKILNPEDEQGIKNLAEISLRATEKLNDSEAKSLSEKLRTQYKRAHITNTTLSTLIPFFILAVALPKLNQGLTKRLVTQEKRSQKDSQEKQASKNTDNGDNKNSVFEKFNKQNAEKVSFKGWKDLISPTCLAQGAQIDPVGNMLMLDYGISGNRLRVARNRQEKIETAIKEGGIVFFMYKGGDLIKHGFQGCAKLAGKLIKLDYITFKSDDFMKNLQDTILGNASAENFYGVMTKNTKETQEKRVLDFIDNAIKNDYDVKTKKFNKYSTLQAALDTGLFGDKKGIFKNKPNVEVETLFEKIKNHKKSIRDSKKFIETEKIIKLSENVKDFYEYAEEKVKNIPADKKQEIVKKLVNSNKNLKKALILINIGICNFALGYALPKIQYKIREKYWGSKEFPGIQNY